MGNDSGIWAHLTHGTAAGIEVAGEVGPRAASVVVGTRGPAVPRGPQHAIGNLVAHLHEVGSRTGTHESHQHLTGVVLYFLFQLTHSESGPIGGQGLLARIGPGVAVVQIEYKLKAGILDAFA